MLKYRLPSGLTMGAVILCSVFLDGPVGLYMFLAFGVFLAFAAVYEFLKMIEKTGIPVSPLIAASFGAIILALTVLGLSNIIQMVCKCFNSHCLYLQKVNYTYKYSQHFDGTERHK